MRKQLNCIGEMIGLTVSGATLSANTHVIAFDDDSFIIIAAGLDYDSDVVTKVDRYPAEPDYRLVHAGVYTQDEYSEFCEERRKRDLAELDRKDRKLYKMLKARYEDEE
jgi:hypothetical protein